MATIAGGKQLWVQSEVLEVGQESFDRTEDACVSEKIHLPLRKGGEETLEGSTKGRRLARGW